MAWPTACDRCHVEAETALDIVCLAYLCTQCWGTGPGSDHMCSSCADEVLSCSCKGEGCYRCRILTVGVVPEPQRESVA